MINWDQRTDISGIYDDVRSCWDSFTVDMKEKFDNLANRFGDMDIQSIDRIYLKNFLILYLDYKHNSKKFTIEPCAKTKALEEEIDKTYCDLEIKQVCFPILKERYLYLKILRSMKANKPSCPQGED